MGVCVRSIMFKQIENYMTNVDEVMTLVRKYDHLIKVRDKDSLSGEFATHYGTAELKQLHQYDMPEDLTDAIFKTIPVQWTERLLYCVNKYEPGMHIPRHRDSQGKYWFFKCIFLQSDKPHFKYWDDEDNEHLVHEIPGATFEMRLSTPHSVTEIGADERPKYSVCIMQGLEMNAMVKQRKVA